METTPTSAATYVPAVFNGTFTVHNPATGNHRTFEIKTRPDDAKFAPGKRVIALLNGPDNEGDYQGFGFVDDTGISVWRNKRGMHGQKSTWEVYARMVWEMLTNPASSWHQRGLTIEASKRCLCCNRKLTTPESLAVGYGPECSEKLGIAWGA